MASSLTGGMRALRRFPVIYGTAWALFWAVIGILLTFIWAHYGSPSDAVITALAYVIHCIAVLFGAITASRCRDERGWYYGGLTGVVYAVLMVVIGLFVYNTFSMDASGLFRVLLMALIGAFGGIIGLNTRRN